MAKSRSCPSCRAAMQRFFAEGVELDRCTSCGGVWLDSGELRQVLGRRLDGAPTGKRSSRRCAFCARPMDETTLRPGLLAEQCEDCGGLYLDEGELESLTFGDAHAAPASAKVAPDRDFLFFYCVECAGRFSLEQGRDGPLGMLCSPCAKTHAPSAPSAKAPEKLPGLLRRLFG